jgi:hypothetical protein
MGIPKSELERLQRMMKPAEDGGRSCPESSKKSFWRIKEAIAPT